MVKGKGQLAKMIGHFVASNHSKPLDDIPHSLSLKNYTAKSYVRRLNGSQKTNFGQSYVLLQFRELAPGGTMDRTHGFNR